jgi:hypothetical protein
MIRIRTFVTIAPLFFGGAASATDDTGKTPAQEKKAEKTRKAAKKGALRKREDPKADLAIQRENVEKLDENARQDRQAKNRAGAWAAERDARRARKHVDEDERRLREKKAP